MVLLRVLETFTLPQELDAESQNYPAKIGWLSQYNQQQLITEVDNLVKIEGTLDEIRELIGDARSVVSKSKDLAKEVKSEVKKTKRKLSKWQSYIRNKRNHIKHRSGAQKGRLNLKAMAKEFKKKGRKK